MVLQPDVPRLDLYIRGLTPNGPPPAHGRSDRIRTCDPLTPSQVRYQAAPRSVGLGGEAALLASYGLGANVIFPGVQTAAAGPDFNTARR